MISDSKRNTLFPGSNAFQQTSEPLGDGSLGLSPKLSTAKLTGRSTHQSAPKSQDSKRSPQAVRGATGLTPVAGSPWESYEKRYRLELGGSVAAAGKITRTRQVFTARSISCPNAKEELHSLRQLRHENFLSAYEVFAFEEAFNVISERLQISLDDTVASPAYSEEPSWRLSSTR